MKRIALALLLLIALTVIASAIESEMYVQTLYIEKIYPHPLGYKIEYRLPTSMFMAAAYIPFDWFGGTGSKAKLVYASDKASPFANVYWRNGEFDHVLLVVQPSFAHVSWGSLSDSESVRSRFDIDEPDFAF